MTLCHGPGCTREATATEFWCGESCRRKWDRLLLAGLDSPRRVILCAAADEQRVRDASQAMPGATEVRVSDMVPVGQLYVVDGRGMFPTDRGAEYPQVASTSPQVAPDHEHRYPWPNLRGLPRPCRCGKPSDLAVEQGQPGWLSRAFGRLFGKGAA